MTTGYHQKILFITQWPFEDALIQTYTLPYIQIVKKITGSPCYLVCFNKNIKSCKVCTRGGIVIIDLPTERGLQFIEWGRNVITILKIINKKKITHLHSFCTPAGAIATILKIVNKKLKLTVDSYEPHAEAMVENGTWSSSGLKYRILSVFEKMEAKIADNLVFAAPGMQDYVLKKNNISVNNYQIKPACVNLENFSYKFAKDESLMRKFNFNEKVVCVYAGKFGGIYLEEESFRFIKKCAEYWGADKFRFLLLSNVDNDYVERMEAKYGILKETTTKIFVPHSNIAKYMGLADFAFCPVKPVPSKRYCSPIKNGEYWALGLPVVITPNISSDSDIISQNNAGAIIQNLDDAGYLEAIKQIDSILSKQSREEIYARIRPLAEKYRNFSIAEKVYENIYASK
ncbi:MAG: hypothetical protein ACLQQ4_19230 [Bacteroidia bacterium]